MDESLKRGAVERTDRIARNRKRIIAGNAIAAVGIPCADTLNNWPERRMPDEDDRAADDRFPAPTCQHVVTIEQCRCHAVTVDTRDGPAEYGCGHYSFGQTTGSDGG